MDWTPCLWFLFNDENVTYLDKRPQDITGGTSVYSLFYVECSYLGHLGSMQILPSNKTLTSEEESNIYSVQSPGARIGNANAR